MTGGREFDHTNPIAAPVHPTPDFSTHTVVRGLPASGHRPEVFRLIGRSILVAAGAVGISLLLSSTTAHAADDAQQPSTEGSLSSALTPVNELLAPVTALLGVGPTVQPQETVALAADVSAETSTGVVPAPTLLAPVVEAAAPTTALLGVEPTAQPETTVALAADLSAEPSTGVVPASALTPTAEASAPASAMLGVEPNAHPEATVAQATEMTTEISTESSAGVEHESATTLETSAFVDTSTSDIDVLASATVAAPEVLAPTSSLSGLLAPVVGLVDSLLAPADTTTASVGLTEVLDSSAPAAVGPVAGLLNPVLALVDQVAAPVVAPVLEVVEPVTALVAPVLGSTLSTLGGPMLDTVRSVGVLGVLGESTATLGLPVAHTQAAAELFAETPVAKTTTPAADITSAVTVDNAAVFDAVTVTASLEGRSSSSAGRDAAAVSAAAAASSSVTAVLSGTSNGLAAPSTASARAATASAAHSHAAAAAAGSAASVGSTVSPSAAVESLAQFATATPARGHFSESGRIHTPATVPVGAAGTSSSSSGSSGGPSSTYAAALTPAPVDALTGVESIHLEDAEILDGVATRLVPTPD